MSTNVARTLLGAFFCVFIVAGTTPAQTVSSSAVRRRCAFDIGSGEIKVSAADVILAAPIPKIIKLLAKTILVPFARNLKDGAIPQWLIKDAIKNIILLRRECEAFGTLEFSGVATSGLRMANDGPRVLAQISRETKVSLQIISGEQEAELGFLAAASALQFDGKNLVVWDIGGGSMQFSMRSKTPGGAEQKLLVSAGHRGVELFRREIAKQFKRGMGQAVNPLSREEIARAIELARQASRKVKAEIRERLRAGHMRVVGLGGVHTESLVNQAGLETRPPYRLYTLAAVRAAAKRAANMSDEDFHKAYPKNKYPDIQATNVALVLGYMEGLKINEIIPLKVNLSDGLLVDPDFWPRSKLQ